MQKTYDECYLICSTAIYFEGQVRGVDRQQGEQDEALTVSNNTEQRVRSIARVAECARSDLLPQCLQNSIRLPGTKRDGKGVARLIEVHGATV